MAKRVSMKQWVEPESTRALKGWPGILSELSGILRELDERADALSLTSLVARRGSTQSSTHAEGVGYSPYILIGSAGTELKAKNIYKKGHKSLKTQFLTCIY